MTRQAHLLVAFETARLPIAGDETLIEKVKTGDDWLVPVATRGLPLREIGPRSAKGAERATLRIISYPRDVFFGRLQHEELLPALAQQYKVLSVCETALVPGVLQLALSGIGIAWVPRRLAGSALSTGALVDLGSDLGRPPLDIVVARLRTPRSRLADNLWAQFELTGGEPAPPASRRRRSLGSHDR